MKGLAMLGLCLAACGPSVPVPDAGSTPMMAIDAGSLGQNLSCRVSVLGAAAGSFPCEVSAVFARGAPNATTITITGNTRDRNPEVNLTLRIPLEPENGKSYGYVDDVLYAELLINDGPAGNNFVASKGQMIDPFMFSFRAGETTGRLATSGGGAQLRFLFQLDATLVPTPSSTAPNNARVSVSVTK